MWRETRPIWAIIRYTSLAVILIDLNPFPGLGDEQDRMDYFMGASRARQLLAVVHCDQQT